MGEKLNGDFEIEPKIFTKILVAVDEDDSQSSINAFNYAVTTAKRLNVPLGIVSILEVGDFNIFDTLSPEVLDERRAQVADDLANYVNKARSFGVKDVTAYSGEGKPGVVIINDILRTLMLICLFVGPRQSLLRVARGSSWDHKPAICLKCSLFRNRCKIRNI